MQVIRHARHADRIMRIEGSLAVAGVGGGMLLWSEAAHLGGYGFATAAFLSLGGIQSGVKALRNYNRYQRGADGEESALASLRSLPDAYTAVTNFVIPGTRQGDTDLILLGPFGILLIEVKAYTGHYACHGDAWFRVRADGTRQPLRTSISRQLKRSHKALQHYLIDEDVAAPVHSVVVFRQTAILDLAHPTVALLPQSDLRDYVQQLPPAAQTFSIADIIPLFRPSARLTEK